MPTRCGETAFLSFSLAAEKQLLHICNLYRRGKHTAESVPLAERLAAPPPGDRVMQYDRHSGDHFGLLFNVLLHQLVERNLLERCGEHIPAVATDPIKFHAKQGPKFATCLAPETWMELGAEAQHNKLYDCVVACVVHRPAAASLES